MKNRWLAVILILALLIGWLQKWFVVILIIVIAIIVIRLLADLYWWSRRDKDE
jgi:Flp pilus assembly protein TadB